MLSLKGTELVQRSFYHEKESVYGREINIWAGLNMPMNAGTSLACELIIYTGILEIIDLVANHE